MHTFWKLLISTALLISTTNQHEYNTTVFVDEQVLVNHTSLSQDHQYNLVISLDETANQTLVISGYTETNTFIGFTIDQHQLNNDRSDDSSNYSEPLVCGGSKIVACPLSQEDLYMLAGDTNNSSISLSLTVNLQRPCVLSFRVAAVEIVSLNYQEDRPYDLFYSEDSFTRIFMIIGDQLPHNEANAVIKYINSSYMGQTSFYASTQLFNSNTAIQSYVLGPLQRTIKLLNNSDIQNYYIHISAIPLTQLQLSLCQPRSRMEHDKFKSYIYTKSLQEYQMSQFQFIQGFSEGANGSGTINDLVLAATPVIGQGIIQIQYCSLINSSVLDEADPYQLFEILIIPKSLRTTCYQSMMQSGGLLLEQLNIKLDDQVWLFGVQFGLFEVQDSHAYRLGIDVRANDWIDEGQCHTYEIKDYEDNVSLSLRYSSPQTNSTQGQLNFTLLTCQFLNDSKQCDREQFPRDSDIFTWMGSGALYSIQVCNPDESLVQYSLMLSYTRTPVSDILPSHSKFAVGMGQKFFHRLRLPMNVQDNRFDNQFKYAIQVRAINGQVALYVSEDDDLIEDSSWEPQNMSSQMVSNALKEYGSALVSLNQSVKCIYIAIQAISSAYVELSLEQVSSPDPQPQPEPEPQPSDMFELSDNQNILRNLSDGSVTAHYRSHIIPYRISINPPPKCVQIYSSSKDIPENRSECLGQLLPGTEFADSQIFIRIFNQDPDEQTIITVSVPLIVLRKGQQISLSCQNECHSEIVVQIKNNDIKNISYSGAGIVQLPDQQTAPNTLPIIPIQCLHGQSECNVTVIAKLVSGTLFIEDVSMRSQTAIWKKKTQFLLPLNLMVPFNSFSDVNTLLLYSPQSCLDAVYTVYSLNTSTSNYLQYSYKAQSEAPFSIQCDPFASTLRIPFQDIDSKCDPHSGAISCFATVTIFQDNSMIPVQNQQKISLSYALSSYLTHLPFEAPYTFLQVYGIKLYGLSTESYSQPALRDNLTQQQITVHYLSQCNAQSNFYNGSSISNQDSELFEICIIEPCAYMVIISECQLPALTTGVTFEIGQIESGSSGYSFTYNQINEDPFRVIVQKKHQTPSVKNFLIIVQQIPQQSTQCSFTNTTSSYEIIYSLNQQNNQTYNAVDASWPNTTGKYLFTILTDSLEQMQELSGMMITVLTYQAYNTSLVISPNQKMYVPFVSGNTHSYAFKYYGKVQKYALCVSYGSVDLLQPLTGTISIEYSETSVLKSKISLGTGKASQCFNVSVPHPEKLILQHNIQMVMHQQGGQAQDSITVQIIQKKQSIELGENVGLLVKMRPTQNQQCFRIRTDRAWNHPISILLLDNSESSPNQSMSQISVLTADPNSEQKPISKIQIITSSPMSYKILVTGLINETGTIQFCLMFSQPIHSYYIIASRESAYAIKSMLPLQTAQSSTMSGGNKYAIHQILMPSQHAGFDPQQGSREELVNLVVELTYCSSHNKDIQVVGTNNYADVLQGSISEISEQVQYYGMSVGRTVAATPGYYYLGVMNQESIDYTLRVYITQEESIPHKKWQLSDVAIKKIDYGTIGQTNQHYLTVVLPPLTSESTLTSTDQSEITYDLYLIQASKNVDQQYIQRCSSSRQNPNSVKLANQPIMHYQVTNPELPLFKIKADQLPKSLSIWASVSVQSASSSLPPIKYYYQLTQYQVTDANAEDKYDQTKIFFYIAIAVGVIFWVGLCAVWLKPCKGSMRRSSVDFEMTETNKNNPTHTIGVRPSSSVQNQDTGYGQFVDETL